MDFSKIKVIIWDLDDTFWKGTLSEGGICPIKRNIELLTRLTNHGLVNTICSKNDFDSAKYQLEKLKCWDFFVFPSIDWTPKGKRISKLLKDMGLRPENALFIDDNIVNLNEVKHYESSILTATPDIIAALWNHFSNTPGNDLGHSRLNKYKILERKKISKESYSDNESFLFASNTQVKILYDCEEHFDRILELINRTNQLNFTKKRIDAEELRSLLSDEGATNGYVTVNDKFGDYGIVGFFSVKENQCIHFLFSCRTIGQGVEQYVYSQLGYPKLDTKGSVVNQVTSSPAPLWINQSLESQKSDSQNMKGKIIFKGPCDLMGLCSYLHAENLITELTFFGKERKNNIEHQSCITNFIDIPSYSDEDIDYLSNQCIFNDPEMFKTSLFDKDVKLIFLSSLHEFHFGIYRHKHKNLKIAFGEWNHPMTDPMEWEGYVNGTTWTSSNVFTYGFLEKFTKDWEFLGRKSESDYIAELELFLTKIPPEAQVCILMGSEKPYSGKVTPAWENRHLTHQNANKCIIEFARNHSNIHLINYTNFIKSSSDYTDSIDHFQRYVYYNISEKANEIISAVLGQKVRQSNPSKIVWDQIKDVLVRIHNAVNIVIKRH